MKKILSLLCLLMLAMTSAWAGDVFTYTFNGGKETSTPSEFFTHDASGKWSFNTKFTGCEYDGQSYSNGLKMEGSTKILFTTTETSTVTIVQSDWESSSVAHGTPKTIKLDDVELAVADAETCTGGRVYTIKDVAAGEHNITQGSGESGLFLVKVEYADAPKKVTFTNDAQWEKVFVWAWNQETGENFTGGEWPGQEIITVDGIYSWETMGNPTFIIFNDGSDSNKTDDLEFKDGGKYNSAGRIIEMNDYTATFTTDGMEEVWAYVWSGTGDNATNMALGKWPGTKMEGTILTFQAEEAPQYIIFHNNAGEQTPDWAFVDGKAYEYMLNEYTATFTTEAGWETVNAYAWSGDGETAKKFLGDWPGTAISGTDGVYTVSLKAFNAPEKIQFNNGEDKTVDLAFINGKSYKWITATPLYALAEGQSFAAGTIVEVKDGDNVVATLTYGSSGNEFKAAIAAINEVYDGFKFMTEGNNTNGDKNDGTFYTIVPTYNGTISVGVRLNGGKKFHISEDGTDLPAYNGWTIAEACNTSYDFAVKAGSTYKIWCDGSKLGFFGFDYKYEKPAIVINSMTIVGEFIGGEPSDEETEPWWNPANGWAMTQDAENPAIWTLTKEFEAEAKTYKYKATANGVYGDFELPYPGDQDFTFGTNEYPAGKYNLTFTANTEAGYLNLAVEPVLNTYTATFTTNAEWEKVYAYAWSGEGENVEEFLGEWPGTKLTATEGVYTVTIEAKDAPQFIVFNNGNSGEGNQTGDLAFENGQAYEYTVVNPDEPQLLVLPDGVELATYTLTSLAHEWGPNNNIEKSVQVGFKDDKIYIQGLNANNEEAWIWGTVEENQVRITSNQLINIINTGEKVTYEWLRFSYYDGMDHEDDPNYPADPDMILSYDRSHGVLTTNYIAFISERPDDENHDAPLTSYWYDGMTLTAPVPDYTLGDVNADGLVTTTDAVMAVDFALERSVPTQAQFLAADVVKSDAITITDAVAIVNMALELPIPNDELTGARMLTGSNYLTMNGQTVNLTNDIDFAGFQMDVTLAEGTQFNGVQLAERAAGLNVAYNRIGENTWRIIAFSLQNSRISGNAGTLLTLDITGNSTIGVTNIEFADAAARAYRLDVNGEATGISGIYGFSSDADIYNVNGVRTNTMQKGVNIIRNANGEVKKVFVK